MLLFLFAVIKDIRFASLTHKLSSWNSIGYTIFYSVSPALSKCKRILLSHALISNIYSPIKIERSRFLIKFPTYYDSFDSV